MEDIEQLKQDNAKLTERLNNAAKFFKDQKAQIDNLTKENKQLKDQIEGFENEFKSNEAYSDDLNKQIDRLEVKLKEQQDSYENKMELLAEELNTKYSNLQNEYAMLDNKYQDAKIELENSLTTEAKLKTDNEALRNSDKANKEAYEQQKKENKETEDQFNKVLSSYEKEIEALKNKNENIESQFNEKVNTLQDALNKYIADTKKFNKLYDDCENEKLAIQNDYDELKDKYARLEIDNVMNEEYNKAYLDDIYQLKNSINDLISINKKLEKNYNELKDNYSLCNDALSKAEDIIMNLNTNVNFDSETAATKNNIKKENIMKSMGDRETSGQNIGV